MDVVHDGAGAGLSQTDRGSTARTRHPQPPGPASIVPPKVATRSRMEFRPTPEEFHCGGPDRSVTVFSTSSLSLIHI